MAENMDILDGLIVGRVEPHIYAFSTDEVPNYLKVGDTYRPVAVRLNEWRSRFPTLREEYREKASIDGKVFFRDYSVHQYLRNELGKRGLEPEETDEDHYSREFFRDTTPADVAEAVRDIREKYWNKIPVYKYYDAETRSAEDCRYASAGMWEPRPNQQAAIDSFVRAVGAGRTNLLMYAVMRFGKSFTSLCCAKEIHAKTVLVVSAKADVREEWKKTVQQADNFNKDYEFLTGIDLLDDEHIVKKLTEAGKGVVIFLTLQDLQGMEIKEKHREIFENVMDLLIIDETHYGARAEKYGQVLRDGHYIKDPWEKHAEDDFVDYADADETLKVIRAGVKLHLSGTPYRILMGSEFSKEDIVAFCQFTDIVAAQEEWDRNYILCDDRREWDNPYFGFPQMIRFAFNPSQAARARLEALRAGGNTYAFSALFRTRSLRKAPDGSHKRFVYEEEVLDLFQVIDGSKEDDELLGFLDYDRIKEGKMCRHMVCVLPYCASCDALEALLAEHRDKFKNLQDYAVINISGIDRPNQYKSTVAVKSKIAQCEKEDRKTITLTVNRMLTGSTVEQWDTMLFFKDTASPQEYDQAIFRLQNQYVKTLTDESGETIRYNMKPQTLLVDFDPGRMFTMQEQKALIYNVNTEEGGNLKLEERIQEELRISPIIAMNKNKIARVEPADILRAVSEYSNSRGVLDETRDIPVDMSLLEIECIKAAVEAQAELGSGKGLELDAYGEGRSDLDLPDGSENVGDSVDGKAGKENQPDSGDNGDAGASEPEDLKGKFLMYYSRILFFAFLSGNRLRSLDDVLASLGDRDNERIARNLSLERTVLSAIRANMNPFILSRLDYKIQNINNLSHDESVQPTERAVRAIHKFGKLSESEVPTPLGMAGDMVALLPDQCFREIQRSGGRILDIASKIGEFAIALCQRAEKLGISAEDIRSSVLAIPTSPVAYEFTRKIYTVLGLDIDCIAARFTAYDLLDVKAAGGKEHDAIDYGRISSILKQKKRFCDITLEDEGEEGDEMKFEAIVGNPPYQVSDGGAQASARPIYHNFVNIAKKLSPCRLTMIMPSRWYAGGKGLDEFRTQMLDDIHIEELDDFLHPEEVFPDTNNRGGICYFLWNADYDNTREKVAVVSHMGDGAVSRAKRSLRTRDLDIFVRDNIGITILDKVIFDDTEVMADHISSRKPFGLDTSFTRSPGFCETDEGVNDPVKCFGKGRKIGYVSRDAVKVHRDWIGRWKVLMPYANNIGTELNDDNQNTFVAGPDTICTETFLVVGVDLVNDQAEAEHLATYLRTKFARFLLSLAKISQHGTARTYKFVPVQDFTAASDICWDRPIAEIDSQLYARYHLDPEEIAHIEAKIKAMGE